MRATTAAFVLRLIPQRRSVVSAPMPSIRRPLRKIFALTFLFPIAAVAATPAASQPLLPTLRIVAPASQGGGWDQTARAMAGVLRQRGVVGKVEGIKRPRAGRGSGLAP